MSLSNWWKRIWCKKHHWHVVEGTERKIKRQQRQECMREEVNLYEYHYSFHDYGPYVLIKYISTCCHCNYNEIDSKAILQMDHPKQYDKALLYPDIDDSPLKV